MISQREVERKYSKLENKISNKINVYICEVCKSKIKTIDLVEGTTPMIINCNFCLTDFKFNTMRSTFYKDDYPDIKITKAWIRPSLKRCYKLRKKTRNIRIYFNGRIRIRRLCGRKFYVGRRHH